ncbi:MAG: hypothetical protein K2Q10_14280, partial [Rhodospirillales bacterium]|nr:hypothetical protein [Rhodospirillales bacterium]
MRFPSLLMIGLAILLACSGLPDSGAASDIRGEPMPLDATNPERGRIGPLTYRGGLYLRAGERRFGGLSSLILDADGRTLTAV